VTAKSCIITGSEVFSGTTPATVTPRHSSCDMGHVTSMPGARDTRPTAIIPDYLTRLCPIGANPVKAGVRGPLEAVSKGVHLAVDHLRVGREPVIGPKAACQESPVQATAGMTVGNGDPLAFPHAPQGLDAAVVMHVELVRLVPLVEREKPACVIHERRVGRPCPLQATKHGRLMSATAARRSANTRICCALIANHCINSQPSDGGSLHAEKAPAIANL
jgi:hypothetical protein